MQSLPEQPLYLPLEALDIQMWKWTSCSVVIWVSELQHALQLTLSMGDMKKTSKDPDPFQKHDSKHNESLVSISKLLWQGPPRGIGRIHPSPVWKEVSALRVLRRHPASGDWSPVSTEDKVFHGVFYSKSSGRLFLGGLQNCASFLGFLPCQMPQRERGRGSFEVARPEDRSCDHSMTTFESERA